MEAQSSGEGKREETLQDLGDLRGMIKTVKVIGGSSHMSCAVTSSLVVSRSANGRQWGLTVPGRKHLTLWFQCM